ncbi:DnaA regulatory inactivator Hda [Dyella sp. LX-66]|uniref:DnaA regulatory inactivator Hda n=1 Tax=unclassified Dyella TaxID=2634549 RepID=UPI001BE0B635|nr:MULTISPECIES: DnaA regulatory inactivator Hda [unclassified Dyella]MBT2116049.1 DnaA regulatory inactivator Hda [Dyella sp. LX-1]MBT2138059.1 DnaA regulatory inactivator Hda [Dyella sp. LX-66]
MIPQLPLALRWPRRQRFEHFHDGSNEATVAAVRQLAVTSGTPWLYLSGPAGSGKSHLLMAACQAASEAGRTVQYLPLATIGQRAAAIRGVAGSELLALDDLGAIAGDREAEHALFDVYNQARAEGLAMLFAAEAIPAQLGLGLPDLRSRLGACQQAVLKPLDDAERRAVLKGQAAGRGIELDDTVLDWLFARYARDLGALLDLLDKLDKASLAAQRRITVPFLRGFLKDQG